MNFFKLKFLFEFTNEFNQEIIRNVQNLILVYFKKNKNENRSVIFNGGYYAHYR